MWKDHFVLSIGQDGDAAGGPGHLMQHYRHKLVPIFGDPEPNGFRPVVGVQSPDGAVRVLGAAAASPSISGLLDPSVMTGHAYQQNLREQATAERIGGDSAGVTGGFALASKTIAEANKQLAKSRSQSSVDGTETALSIDPSRPPVTPPAPAPAPETRVRIATDGADALSNSNTDVNNGNGNGNVHGDGNRSVPGDGNSPSASATLARHPELSRAPESDLMTHIRELQARVDAQAFMDDAERIRVQQRLAAAQLALRRRQLEEAQQSELEDDGLEDEDEGGA